MGIKTLGSKLERSVSAIVVLVVIAVYTIPSAQARSYTVQIGAFRDSASTYANTAQDYGEVFSTVSAKGYTLISVGNFQKRSAADALREKLLGRFPDAYVRSSTRLGQAGQARQTAKATVASAKPRPGAQPLAAGPDQEFSLAQLRQGEGFLLRGTAQEQALWRLLSVDDQKRVVSLDGELHVKDDGRFVPLVDFVR